MFKKLLAVILSCVLVNVVASVAYASSQDDKQARRIEKVKENVLKLGVGSESRVEVTLHDGRNFKGTIREITDDNFLVMEENTNRSVTVPYADVAKLKGKNGLTAAKVGINVAKGAAIVAGVAAAVTLLAYLLLPRT